MPVFSYKAMDLHGNKIKDKMDSPDKDSLYCTLKEQHIFMTDCVEISEDVITMTIKSKDLAEFANQLGTMLVSGISLSRALNIITQRCTKKKLQMIYQDIYAQVQRGVLLSDALEKQGKAFPVLFINMVRAGENSGKMANIAMKIANHYEKDSKLRAKVKSAMTYPIILLCLTFGVVMILFTFILPKFFKLFENMELPANTRVLVAFSKFMNNHGIISFILIALFVCAIALVFQIPVVKKRIDLLKLRIPVLSQIFTTIYTARFARGLSSLYSSGLSMIQSLQICQGLIGNQYIENQFPDMVRDVRNGVALSKTIAKQEGFDSKLMASVYVGEETGRINEVLETMADSFDYEADQATGRLITLLEPAMIIVMAVIIGYIIISVMMPIIQYYQSLM